MEAPHGPKSEEDRRAAVHREHVEAVDLLRGRIETLEQREPELRKQIPALRKQIADLNKELVRRQRAAQAKPAATADEPEDRAADEEIEQQIAALNAELDELNEQLAALSGELELLGPELIQVRCTLGMKMSDFALDDHEGHEDALTYLQPLLAELRGAYGRATWEAERNAADVDEQLKALQAEPHDRGDEVAALVEQRFKPLIAAETIGVNIEQANVRVARHRLALVDREDTEQHLARELQLDDALAVLDEARARVTALQQQRRDALERHSHPTLEKGKQVVKKRRFGRR